MIAPTFWPLVGGSVRSLTRLAFALADRGVTCRIVAPLGERQWPTELRYGPVDVSRPAFAGRTRWGRVRYRLALSRWLRSRRPDWDAVWVEGLRGEAFAALGALRRADIPVILRARDVGANGDIAWQERAALGRRTRRRCLRADAIVATHPWARDELVGAGYPADRVHLILDGAAVGEPRGAPRRAAARAALADANFDLNAPIGCPVALQIGPLVADRGLFELVDAWARVVRPFPDARLWLVGDGPLREPLRQRIGDRDLRTNVFLPGTFDEVDDLLHAADLFVTASSRPGVSNGLLEAMAFGVPCVAGGTPGDQRLITDHVHGLLAENRLPDAIARAVIRVFSVPDLACQLGAAARDRVAAEFAIEDSARRCDDLMRRLVQGRHGRDESSVRR